MKRTALVTSLLVGSALLGAVAVPRDAGATVSPQWLRRLISPGQDWGRAVAVAPNGDVAVAGFATRGLPGVPATANGPFVAKYDAHGRWQWTRELPTPLPTGGSARGVAFDHHGNIVIAGYDFVSSATNQAQARLLLAKYDTTGHQRWVRHLAHGDGIDAEAIAVDSRDGVIVAGNFAYGGLTHSRDAMVARFDAAGTLRWMHRFGSEADDFGRGVAVAPDGAILVLGLTSGHMPGAPEASAGGDDQFLAQFTSHGRLEWTHQFGGSGFEDPNGIAVDAHSIVTVGSSSAELPGAPEAPAGSRDAYVAVFDRNGTPRRAHLVGSSAFEEADGVALDAAGGAVVVGYTGGQLPGAEPSHGVNDAILFNLDRAGSVTQRHQFGSDGNDTADAVAVAPDGAYAVAGTTTGFGATATEPGQGDDAFVAKL